VAGLLDQIAGLADTPQKRAALAALVGELERNPAHPPERFNRGVRNVAGGMAKAIGEGIAFPRKYMETYQPGSMAADNPAATEWAAGTAMNMVGAPMMTGGVPGMGAGIRAYHGSTERNLKRLSKDRAVETRGATFHATNPDAAETFTFPREYGEMLTYDPVTGRKLKRGRVYETELTPKNLYEVPPEMGQRFIDDTTYQGQIIRDAISKGHDAVVARNVKEGIGETYPGDVYATFTDDIVKILRKYGLAGLAAMPALANAPQLEQAQ
jgi:hypothetical protein